MIETKTEKLDPQNHGFFSLLDFDPKSIDTESNVSDWTTRSKVTDVNPLGSFNAMTKMILDADSRDEPDVTLTDIEDDAAAAAATNIVPIPSPLLKQLVDDYKKVADDNSLLHSAMKDLQHMNGDLVVFAQRLLQQVSSFSPTVTTNSTANSGSASLEAEVHEYLETLSQGIDISSTAPLKCYDTNCVGCKAVQHIIQTPMPTLDPTCRTTSPESSVVGETDAMAVYPGVDQTNSVDSVSASIAREWESMISQEQDIAALKTTAQNHVKTTVSSRGQAPAGYVRRVQFALWLILMVSIVLKLFSGYSLWNSFHAT